MRCLDNRYVSIFKYHGYDICTLKVANKGDDLGFKIDSDTFTGQSFNNPEDAMKAIDQL